ncbi:hypothetical protein LCGC14_1818150 [marine sediment metagenome]|uniref:Uncharacterized protein n=1 Tax=marine sediment metagenome TaxID=412755 RepID=A0A0F9JJ93_9ZZZZ
MDQKMKSTLADCYSEISAIWLGTAKVAQAEMGWHNKHDDVEFWEAFERRCCIRAGYYARLAEQHRPPPGHFKDDEDGWVTIEPHDVAKRAKEIDTALKQALDVEEGGIEPRVRSLDEMDEIAKQTTKKQRKRPNAS